MSSNKKIEEGLEHIRSAEKRYEHSYFSIRNICLFILFNTALKHHYSNGVQIMRVLPMNIIKQVISIGISTISIDFSQLFYSSDMFPQCKVVRTV